MSIKSYCDSLKESLRIYHEHHILKYDTIIAEIRKYLKNHAPQYELKSDVEIVDNDNETYLGDDFIVLPVDVLLTFWEEHQYLDTETICDVIRWYLKTYQSSYELIPVNN